MTHATADRLGLDFERLEGRRRAATSRSGRIGQPDDIAAVASLPVQRGRRLRLRTGDLRGRRPEGLTSTVELSPSRYSRSSRSAYFFSTALRRIFWLGVTSPSSMLNSLRQDLELLDRLPPFELAVGLCDVALDQFVHLGRAERQIVAGSADRCASAHSLIASGSRVIKRGDVLAALAVHQDLADVRDRRP